VDSKAIKKPNSNCCRCGQFNGGTSVHRCSAHWVTQIKIKLRAHGQVRAQPGTTSRALERNFIVIKKGKYDLGIVVDPDVDRLAFIQEDGKAFGEEYTLVAIADYVLSRKKGNTVSNLSRHERCATLRNGLAESTLRRLSEKCMLFAR